MVHAAEVQAPTRSSIAGLDVPDELKPLFTPVKLGRFELAHRLVYPPLTRCRAINNVTQPSAVEYYTQRTTSGGLLIAEGTTISQEANGYPHTPGLYTDEQVEAWKPVTRAVKELGGVFFCQLWHCGRASHPDYQLNGAAPIGPSAIAISNNYPVFTPKGGPFEYPVPRALETHEVPLRAEMYANAARNAIAAGFDGVEIHGANGYLIDEFLKESTNKRTDRYGGSIEARCRFALEVVKAVVDAVGADRVGIRISPFTGFLDAADSHPYALHTYLTEELNKFNLAYLHMVEPRVLGNTDKEHTDDSLEPFRKVYNGTFMVAGGFNRGNAAKAVADGHADLVAVGRHWLANPDLPKRWILNKPINKYNRDTFYTQGLEGYTDYPFIEDGQGAQNGSS